MSKQSDRTRLLEALLFASATPLTTTMIVKALGWSEAEVDVTSQDLGKSLKDRGLQLITSEDGFTLGVASTVRKDIAHALRQSAQPLSQSSLEVLTIVAYRQPIAKTEIDEVRGVASDASLKSLLSRDLIVSTGMREGVIRYRTTHQFLSALGLTKLEDLPKPKGIKA